MALDVKPLFTQCVCLARLDETMAKLNGTPEQLIGLVMDQADLGQVERAMRQLLHMPHVETIDGLLLNAAVFGGNCTTTNQGHETTFGVNHLSHYVMVEWLKERLIKSAPSRIVIMSSESHRMPRISSIRYEDFSPAPSGYWSLLAYNRSKFANMLHMSHLSRQMSNSGVNVYACHPGNMIRSSITREWWLWKLIFWMASPITKSLSQGAATGLNCLVRPETANFSGQYWNQCRPCNPLPAATDAGLVIEMDKLSQALTREFLP